MHSLHGHKPRSQSTLMFLSTYVFVSWFKSLVVYYYRTKRNGPLFGKRDIGIEV
jgi:hypothetical protein